jgi:tripartite-type tricarboxylate transporter receptor subunit TctC
MNTHHFHRRAWLRAAAAAGLTWVSAVKAQPVFPSRPVRLVVPFAAGGVADLTARTVAAPLAERLGQPVVIENRPGAGGIAAGEVVARAEPDGHTWLLMSNATAVSARLFKTLPFDAQKDFAPISLLGSFDLAVFVPEGSRFGSVAELLAWARSHPGQLNLGTIALGSTQHLAAELIKSSAGIDVQVVPFNGSPAVLNALRGNQIDASVEIVAPMLSQVTAKAIRALAVLGERRNRQLPQVPTLAESGVPQFQVASWNALATTARTPAAAVARLNRDVRAVLALPDVVRRLEELGVAPGASSPEQLADWLGSETRRWGDVITRSRIPLN